jgi:hypothetical protein
MEQEYVTFKFGPGRKYELHIPAAKCEDLSALRQSLLEFFSELGAKLERTDPKQLKFNWPEAA